MICRNCGGEYPDYKDNCPNCGTRNPNVSYNSQYSAPQNSGNRNGGQYGYQQPVNTVYVNEPDVHYDEHVSIGGWIGRWLVMCIPIVNIIMLFVWAFGGSRKYSLKTWARARLLCLLRLSYWRCPELTFRKFLKTQNIIADKQKITLSFQAHNRNDSVYFYYLFSSFFSLKAKNLCPI